MHVFADKGGARVSLNLIFKVEYSVIFVLYSGSQRYTMVSFITVFDIIPVVGIM